MSKLDKTEVLAAFENAYQAANGKKPEVVAKSGWYSVDGGKNMRLADLAALAEELASGGAAVAEEKPAKAEKPKAKAKAKPAKTESVSKQKEYTVVSQSGEGFTAEEYWIKELAEKDHDTRLPRGVV